VFASPRPLAASVSGFLPPLWSLARGVGHIPETQLPRPFSTIEGLVWFALAVGVCNNPDPISSVRGVNGASWNDKWDGLIPEAFQVRKAALEAHRLVNKASHILANDPSRP